MVKITMPSAAITSSEVMRRNDAKNFDTTKQAPPRVHRSISPNTMSREPSIAETSASICPRVRKSIAVK
jgi:hypothetical protein